MKAETFDSSVASEAKIIEPEPFPKVPTMQEISISEKFSKDKGWQQHSARTRYLPFRWWNKQLNKAIDTFYAQAQTYEQRQAQFESDLKAWEATKDKPPAGGGAPPAKPEEPKQPAVFGDLPPKYGFQFLDDYYSHLVELYFGTEAKVYDEWLQYKVQRPLESSMTTDLDEFRKLFYEVMKFADEPQPMSLERSTAFADQLRKAVRLVDTWIVSKEDGYVSNFVGAVGMAEEEERREWHTMVSALGVEGMKRYYTALVYCTRALEGKDAALNKISELSLADKTMLSLFWVKDFEVHQLNIISAVNGAQTTAKARVCYW